MQGERTSRLFLFLAIGAALFFFFGTGGDSSKTQPIEIESRLTPEQRSVAQSCVLETPQFRATFSSRGAVLTHFEVLTAQYRSGGKTFDLSTTPNPVEAGKDPQDPNSPGDREFRQQFFANFRNPTVTVPKGATYGVSYDSLDWEIVPSAKGECLFEAKNGDSQLTKRFSVTSRLYEIALDAKIKNLAETSKIHAFAVDTVAWWSKEEVAGKMFRQSPFLSHVECLDESDSTIRLKDDDFAPKKFADDQFKATGKYGFYENRGEVGYTAISNAYFSQALVPVASPTKAICQVQIEQRPNSDSVEAFGHFYRARLAYDAQELKSGEEAEYRVIGYIGPLERKILAAAAGEVHELSNLIDLGFFATIAKNLVNYLIFIYGKVHSWGLAIILLTVTVRLLLFPLSVPGVKNMIKMRELKPLVDELNEKFKDDPQGKTLAQMALWKEHGVSPFKGCLPQLASMPVWFALYQSLQTAVELYNIPFLWFPDLSKPDPYFILPFIIGGVFFLQQKLVPMQGQDPAQQKMMMYLMPGMFTVFMLFLPAGLGVYMFTNSTLAIIQQRVVEWHARRSIPVQAGASSIALNADGSAVIGSNNKSSNPKSPSTPPAKRRKRV